MEVTEGKKKCMFRCNSGIFPKYKIIIGECANIKSLFRKSRLKCQMVSKPMNGKLSVATINRKKSIIKVNIEVTEKTSSKTDGRNLKQVFDGMAKDILKHYKKHYMDMFNQYTLNKLMRQENDTSESEEEEEKKWKKTKIRMMKMMMMLKKIKQ